MTKTAGVERWLTQGAPGAAAPAMVLDMLCARLLACGAPLSRAAVFVQTLHPDVMGRSFTWRPGAEIDIAVAPNAFVQSPEFLASPVWAVRSTGQPIRRRLADPSCPMDFSILATLRDEGNTDYLSLPLRFTNGETQCVSWCSAAPGGFSPEDVEGLGNVTLCLARVAEIWALRRIAGTLLDTYVGRRSGERILAGRIQRGDTEAIGAVVWLSDLRGFTRLSETLPPGDLVAHLNRAFDCQVAPITEAGGEVLKYMGDGLLAIFPIGPDQPAPEACASAVAAAEGAMRMLAEALPMQGYGIALHAGDVLYGNVGAAGRLDFTCIGPAVNMAARIEALTKTLGHAVLASAAVAGHLEGRFRDLGGQPLRGFDQAQPVFGLIGSETG
ncbi:MAG: adenylate/guanylate cyclase domain-containing protein [Paracoccaceae bacterium]